MNKKLMKKIIRIGDVYSKNRIRLLDFLIDLSIDDSVKATTRYIADHLDLHIASVNQGVALFKRDGLILPPARWGVYHFNMAKFKQLGDNYKEFLEGKIK